MCSAVFKAKQFADNDFILSSNFNLSAKFSGDTGLLKAVTVGSSEVLVEVDFVSYGTRTGKEKSGAYLFLPDKEATTIVSLRNKPKIITIIGPLVRMYVSLHTCVLLLMTCQYSWVSTPQCLKFMYLCMHVRTCVCM